MAQRSQLQKSKNRRESGYFVALPFAILEHENFINLSPRAVKLLLDLCAQLRFKGDGIANNGDLCAAWTLMVKRGWRSKATLQLAKNELLDLGWIIVTRQGGRRIATLYAVTWLAVDQCGDKLDMKPTRVAPGNWRKSKNKSVTPNMGYIAPKTVSIKGGFACLIRSIVTDSVPINAIFTISLLQKLYPF